MLRANTHFLQTEDLRSPTFASNGVRKARNFIELPLNGGWCTSTKKYCFAKTRSMEFPQAAKHQVNVRVRQKHKGSVLGIDSSTMKLLYDPTIVPKTEVDTEKYKLLREFIGKPIIKKEDNSRSSPSIRTKNGTPEIKAEPIAISPPKLDVKGVESLRPLQSPQGKYTPIAGRKSCERNSRFLRTYFPIGFNSTSTWDIVNKTHYRSFMGKKLRLDPLWPLLGLQSETPGQIEHKAAVSLSPLSRKLRCDPEGTGESSKKKLRLTFAGGKKKAIIILPSIYLQNSIKQLERSKVKPEPDVK